MSFVGSALFRMAAIGTVLILSSTVSGQSAGQQMPHDHTSGTQTAKPASGTKADADALTVRFGDKKIVLLPQAFNALSHKAVTVHNDHTNADERYSGVLLSELLNQVGAPLGTGLHGRALASYVLAAGSDGYRVIYSIAEIDPSFHTGDVMVADAPDGKAVGEDGPFRLVNTEDKRPARWVRNLVSINVVTP